MSRNIVLFVALLGAAACSSSGTKPSNECEPGDVMDCTCDDGVAGTRTCLADGSAWGDCECESENQAPEALTELPPPTEIDGGFGFLEASDEVSMAMAVLWEEGLKAPSTSEEMSASMAAKDEALATIEANLPDVQAELLTALESIEGDDVGRYVTLEPLIKVAGDSAPILAHFQGIAMRELTTGEQEVTHDPTDTALLRILAMRVLAHQAKRGSETARNHLRRAVTSPSAKVRRDAVKHYYRIAESRRVAQRELRMLMSPEDRHMLYLF
jgi:hypothetical protein